MKSIKDTQLYQLTSAYFLETIREPEVLFWGMIFPVLISIGLGLAFTQTAETKFRIAVIEHYPAELDSLLHLYARPDATKAIVWKVTDQTLGNTVFHFTLSDRPSAIVGVKRGETDLIITDSAGVARYHFDPHHSQAQLAYMKLSALVRNPTATAHADNTDIEPLQLRGVRYIDFLIPGLIAFGLMSSIMWGISYTIIERRSQKLLRRMVATPMRKSRFLIAMMLVRTMMNVVEALILFFFAWLVFDTRIQGNVGALTVLFLAGNVAFTGIGVLVSSRTSKTEVGTGWINAVTMPMLILSGVFFSYHNFPDWSIGLIRILPLTALADGMRSIFNEGAGWMETGASSIGLSLFGVGCFVVGMKWFKWY
jgi:ABC-type multidrug transport system permease subunit